MSELEKLREQYEAAEEQFERLYETAEKEKRSFSDEEKTKLVELDKEMKRLAAEIEEQEAIEKRRLDNLARKERAGKDQRRNVKKAKDDERSAVKRYSLLRAIRSQLPNNNEPLAGLEKEMHEEALREARSANITDLAGVGVPSFFLQFQRAGKTAQKRDLVVGTTTAGGFTVDTELGELIPFLRPRLAVEAAGATTLTGLTSNIDFPRNDSTTSATWEGETDSNADDEPSFDRVQMEPHRLGANTPFSKQLLVQSSIDVENMVRRQLERAIAEALDSAAISGDSGAVSSQPDGILNINSINTVTIGTNGGAMTYPKVVEMETKIATDNADFGRLAYLTTPGVRGQLKTTEKATNTGMFVWSDGPLPTDPSQPRVDEVNGYRAFVSTQVPSDLTKGSGTDLHAMIFGNFEELIIGQWGGLDIVVDPYSQKKKAQIEITANTWWDIAARHPESFCAVSEIDLT
jgi:HK97 family phage major capsid protein